MAERLTCNEGVGGSIPLTSSIKSGQVPKWPNGPDCVVTQRLIAILDGKVGEFREVLRF